MFRNKESASAGPVARQHKVRVPRLRRFFIRRKEQRSVVFKSAPQGTYTLAEVQAEWEEAEAQRKRAEEQAAREAEKAAQPIQPTPDEDEEVEISEEEAFELLFDKSAPIPAPKTCPKCRIWHLCKRNGPTSPAQA